MPGDGEADASEALIGLTVRIGAVVAVHVTNRYLDLAPVVDALAAALQKQVRIIHSEADPPSGIYAADWSLVADNLDEWRSRPQTLARKLPPWTDDYSNLFRILK